MRSLLVTGGAGFIGTNFVSYWRARNAYDTIVVLDTLTYAGNKANLADVPQIIFIQGNICDTALVKRLIQNHGIDVIVHFAAESHVDRSIDGPDVFIETNVGGTHSLLKAAKECWLDRGSGRDHRFHHISTDEVFGSLKENDPAFHEDTPYAPNSPYSASKAASDHLVRAYHHTFGLQTAISNCSNNYGPYQFPEKLIPLFFLNAVYGRPLPIYGQGINRRDWLHVEDHCRAIEVILKNGTPGRTYNVGGKTERTNTEVARAICDLVDQAFQKNEMLAKQFPNAPAASGKSTWDLVTYVADRPGHDLRYSVDTRRIENELHFTWKHDFATGLQSTLNWYLENPHWKENVAHLRRHVAS